MRNKFEEQLELLNSELIEMGAMIENAISGASTAIETKNIPLAKKIIAMDDEIDQKEKDIEALCLKLLLKQQPVARDLRQISSALKMITDMERIGDQAADISEIALFLADSDYIKKIEHIPQMAHVAIKMVNNAIDAFVRKDLDLAQFVMQSDDEVDALFDTIKKDLIRLIREDAKNGEQAMDLLMIAKYLERIGDHANNIAEWVAFSITGEHKYKGD